MDGGPPYRSFATLSQEAALWIAGLFISLTFFGFLPGATKNIESLSVWSTADDARLFGLFEVSLLHNGVHLVIGAAALVASGTDRRSRIFLCGVGIALLMLVLYGQLAVHPALDSLVPVSPADAWLHAIVGCLMFGLAITAPRRRTR